MNRFNPNVLLAGGLVCLAGSAKADLIGLWDFENAANPGAATVGNDLTYNNVNGSVAAQTGPAGDGAISIGVGDSFSLNHGIAPNGGSTEYVNEYTVVYDLYLPASTDATWRSLLQTTSTPDGNDGDVFVSTSNNVGVGAIGYSTGTLAADTWYRVVFSADIGTAGSSFFTTVLDTAGNEVWTYEHLEQGLDGRHALYSTANDNIVHFFADDSGEDHEVYVSTLALFDDNLTLQEARALGAPGSSVVVPEPGSLALLGLGGLMIARRRRTR
ncbi:MAG: PEP-CTERM sorting domain-containing protein [Phycisphaerales bacterium JB063]